MVGSSPVFVLSHSSQLSTGQAHPIPALTDRSLFFRQRQNMELFHPVRSCTHLFWERKTQGRCVVMIGFLLCNLLGFSVAPTRQHYFIPTHTHSLTHARMSSCNSISAKSTSSQAYTGYTHHLWETSSLIFAAYLCPSVILLLA